MAKTKYFYNANTLKYEKVVVNVWRRIWGGFGFLATALVFAAIFVLLAYKYVDSPKEKSLKRDINRLNEQYDNLQGRMEQMKVVLKDLQDRDDNIYRTIFEAEPIPIDIRQAGIGKNDKYKSLEGYTYSDLMTETTRKLDKITKQMYVQSKSYDELQKLVKTKEDLLASVPAIQPVSNKKLDRIASGFGYRIHPIYKTAKMHTGIDFTAAQGTEIYATGDGIVAEADASMRGYGNCVVINHGYGYKTLYGHMLRSKVRPGQKVKRGEVIGYVGSTGTSTGPHLHYEVRRGNNPINPINFFFNDLTPEEYEKMTEIADRSNQSFD